MNSTSHRGVEHSWPSLRKVCNLFPCTQLSAHRTSMGTFNLLFCGSRERKSLASSLKGRSVSALLKETAGRSWKQIPSGVLVYTAATGQHDSRLCRESCSRELLMEENRERGMSYDKG